MSGINPIGGGGNSQDMNRHKTPREHAEEAAGRLRNNIKRTQQRFRRRMEEKLSEATPPSPGLSIDTGKTFDSALLPADQQDPPAKKDKEAAGDERLDTFS